MVNVTCYSGATGGLTQVEVDSVPLGEKVRKRLVRQACLHYAAAVRQGTHSTLTRSQVNYNERKPWRQKGTGRARSGDFSSPVWRGGGVVFGPKPRDYATNLPRRMRREALRSALLGKLLDGQVRLIEGVKFAAPKTKEAAAVLRALGVADERVTLVLAERAENVHESFRNLPNVAITMASDLNALSVLRRDLLVMDRRALEEVIARLGNA